MTERMKLVTVPLSVLILTTVFSSTGLAAPCDEKVLIGTRWYFVGEHWCGKRIDVPLPADSTALVRLSDSFSDKQRRIYLEKHTGDAFVMMAEAAREDDVVLHVKSGYRSARYQKQLITRRLAAGKRFEQIIMVIAPPGYSQHETGKVVDLTSDVERFHLSKAYAWLKNNAATYGFRESYPKNNDQNIAWEPWHWHYMDTVE